MYYPLLRGRPFELLALRGLSDNKLCQQYVSPIIEPVRSDLRSLSLANEKFASDGFAPFLITFLALLPFILTVLLRCMTLGSNSSSTSNGKVGF